MAPHLREIPAMPWGAGGSPGGLEVPRWGLDALSWDHCTVENWTTRNCPVIPCIFPPFAQCQLILRHYSLSLQASNTDYIARHSAPRSAEALKLYEPMGGKQRAPQMSCCPFRRVQRCARTALCTCRCTKPVRRCHAVVPWLAKAISLCEQHAVGSRISLSAAYAVYFLLAHSSVYWPANTSFCCFILETN